MNNKLRQLVRFRVCDGFVRLGLDAFAYGGKKKCCHFACFILFLFYLNVFLFQDTADVCIFRGDF